MNDTWVPGVRFSYHPDGEAIAKCFGWLYYNPAVDIVIARIHRRTGKLLGGTILTNYTGRGGSVIMHAAGFTKHWLSREYLWVVFDYAFNQMQVKKIFVQVEEDNVASDRFTHNLGFALEHVIHGAYPGKAMLLKSMDRDRCRFLRYSPPELLELLPHG